MIFSGARPEPFKAIISSDPAGLNNIKQSPPIPAIWGSNKPCSKAAAIAASTAFPPASNIWIATFEDNGFEVEAIPLEPYTGDRPGK